jgi:CheY-like chemotaxis protein
MANDLGSMGESLHFETLPRQAERHRRTRAGVEDRSRHDNPRPGQHRESSLPRWSRLPRDLVGLKVLLVDDDEETVDLFAAVLTTCGAVSTTATTAREALRLASEIRPDVVVSDIAMAGEDGYWLVREIRRLADHVVRRVPVVAATAYGHEHSRARVVAAGFFEHLQKPVDPEVLCRTVATAAGR